MWGDYGYFEGDKLGKPYDLRLLRRFLSYGRPYRWLLIIASVLVLAGTAADLVLPYLTKIAIDRYIVVSHQEVVLDQNTPPDLEQTARDNLELLRPSGRAGLYFLSGENARKMDPAVLTRLKKAGIVRPEQYYLLDNQPGPALETAAERPDLFQAYPKSRPSALPIWKSSASGKL